MSTLKLAVECMVFPRQVSCIITQELLEQCLLKAGYTQCKITLGYWKHKWRPIDFTLVVDNFAIKYTGKEHILHLIKALKEHDKVEEDWEGTRYLGIKHHKVHLSRPEYIECALARFGHPILSNLNTSPAPTHDPNIQHQKTPQDAYSPLPLR